MPRSLHDKNFFCRFRKRVGAFQPLQKTKLRFYESSIPSCQWIDCCFEISWLGYENTIF
jgi:hypothetical protein